MRDVEGLVQEELRRTLRWLLPLIAALYLCFLLFDAIIGAPLGPSLLARGVAVLALMAARLALPRLPMERTSLALYAAMLGFGLSAAALTLAQRSVYNAVVLGALVGPILSSFVHQPLRVGLVLFGGAEVLTCALPVALVWRHVPAGEQPMALAGAGASVALAAICALNAASLRRLKESQAGARARLERARADVEAALQRDGRRNEEIGALLGGLAGSAEVLRRSVRELRHESDALAGKAAQMRAGLEAGAADGAALSAAAVSIDERARGCQGLLGALDRRDREEAAPGRAGLCADSEAMVAAAAEIARAAGEVSEVARQARMLALNASIEAPRHDGVERLAERMRSFSGEARDRAGRIQELARRLVAAARRLEGEASLYAEAEEGAAAGPRAALSDFERVAARSGEIRAQAVAMASAVAGQAANAEELAAVAPRLEAAMRTLEQAAEELRAVAGGLESWRTAPAGNG